MTIRISTISKTKKAVYWLATGFTATAYFIIGVADILHAPMMMASLARLGYPVYLATILGVWKLLGAAAIIAARTSSYEGMGLRRYVLQPNRGCSVARRFERSPKEILVPLGLLVVVLISMGLRSETAGRALFTAESAREKRAAV